MTLCDKKYKHLMGKEITYKNILGEEVKVFVAGIKRSVGITLKYVNIEDRLNESNVEGNAYCINYNTRQQTTKNYNKSFNYTLGCIKKGYLSALAEETFTAKLNGKEVNFNGCMVSCGFSS